jgi:predicted dehydrogenase
MLRVGLVGTSWWADAMYLPALADHPRGAITAICGRDPERTLDAADRWGIEHAFTDWTELLDSGLIDAVLVASPNNTHHDITMAAIERDLAVLCEKPVALTAAEAEAMAEAAAARGLVTMVPFTYRWMPTHQWIKELIDDGYVGRPYHVTLRYFAGFARDPAYSWRFDVEHSGGGCSATREPLPAPGPLVAGRGLPIGALSTTFVDRDPRPDGTPYIQGDDAPTITVRFDSGAVGTLQVSAMCWEGTPFGQTQDVEIHGSDGTLYAVNDWDSVQEVRGVRAGEPGLRAARPRAPWQGARRSPVPDTYATSSAGATRWPAPGSTPWSTGGRASPTGRGRGVQRLLEIAARAPAPTAAGLPVVP